VRNFVAINPPQLRHSDFSVFLFLEFVTYAGSYKAQQCLGVKISIDEGHEEPATPRDVAGEETAIGGGCSCVVAMTTSCMEWEGIAPSVKLDAPTAALSKTFSSLRLLKLLASTSLSLLASSRRTWNPAASASPMTVSFNSFYLIIHRPELIWM